MMEVMEFGEFELKKLKVNQIAVLPQVRKIKNERHEEIIDSIERQKLINQIDVAKLTYDEFNSHIKFINRLWKKSAKIESFEQIDGYYYVVIAGHSRLEAIKTIGKKNNCECNVTVKIHDVHTSEEIIALQLAENIYSSPNPERRIITIIESYRIGLETGKYKNEQDFYEKEKKKFGKRMLSDIIAFSYLPVEIQEEILSGKMKYEIGVELGRMFPIIERYEKQFVEAEETLNKRIYTRYAMIYTEVAFARTRKKKLEIIAGTSELLENPFKPKEVVQQSLLDSISGGVERQTEEYFQQIISENIKMCRTLGSLPYEVIKQIFILNSEMIGIDNCVDLENLEKLYKLHTEAAVNSMQREKQVLDGKSRTRRK